MPCYRLLFGDFLESLSQTKGIGKFMKESIVSGSEVHHLPDLKAMVALKIENIFNRGELQIFGHNTEIMGKMLQRHRQE